MGRYMLVSDALQRIMSGPCLWDGVAPVEPGTGMRLVPEGDPSIASYTTPALPSDVLAELVARYGSRVMRRAKSKTLILILGSGTTDVTFTWAPAMPSDKYTVTVADDLPAGTTAAVLDGQTAAQCKVRLTVTNGLALGTVVDATAWT